MEHLHLSCTPPLQAGAEMKGQGTKQHWFSQNWDHNYLPVELLTAPSSVLMQVTTSFDDAWSQVHFFSSGTFMTSIQDEIQAESLV